MFTEAHRAQFETDGYFIVEDAVDPDMLEPLLAAVKRVKQKVRSGAVDVYTHWTDPGEPWAIRGLFDPAFDEPIFAEYLMSEPVMSYVEPFLGSELQMGSLLLFTNPYHKESGIGWHRDFGKLPRDGSEEVELEILNRPMVSLKWHLPLVDDSCLKLVPGTNKRYRTEEEQNALLNDRNGSLSTGKVIHLKAGQSCFWNGYMIHQGIYLKDVERLTLAGSWRKYQADDEPGEVDPRHRWQLDERVRNALPEGMKIPYDRWRALQIDY